MDVGGRGFYKWKCDRCRTCWYESRVCGCVTDVEPLQAYEAEPGYDLVECAECGACWRTLSFGVALTRGFSATFPISFVVPLGDPEPLA